MSIEELFGARTATVVPDVIDPAEAAAARARLARDLTRYALLDRGSYEHAPAADPPLFARLARLASDVTGRTLAVAEARVLRLAPGDYILAHHDRVHAGLPIELVLDLSPMRLPGADIHYRRRGQVFFEVPSAPGAASIVERGPTVTCNHRYVSQLHAAAVVRLVLLLRGPA